ncbi:hypothetical protein [Frankia sp. CiP3]|uniref:hypothetical protein n=1 Tax=Frankia sp. CiP3 TaxID=2880971 RepID=UPI001EF43A92|nr:hypothetical protein [Frankia sp. CiP3]
MKADSLGGQIIAVLSRRTPAFTREGEPQTFPGLLRTIRVERNRMRLSAPVGDDTRNSTPPPSYPNPTTLSDLPSMSLTRILRILLLDWVAPIAAAAVLIIIIPVIAIIIFFSTWKGPIGCA